MNLNLHDALQANLQTLANPAGGKVPPAQKREPTPEPIATPIRRLPPRKIIPLTDAVITTRAYLARVDSGIRQHAYQYSAAAHEPTALELDAIQSLLDAARCAARKGDSDAQAEKAAHRHQHDTSSKADA
jgi:hypothetical protein